MNETEPKRTTDRTQDLDPHVGACIRERQIMRSLTQQQLADHRERMCLEFARNFAQISKERHQEASSRLARALAPQH